MGGGILRNGAGQTIHCLHCVHELTSLFGSCAAAVLGLLCCDAEPGRASGRCHHDVHWSAVDPAGSTLQEPQERACCLLFAADCSC